MQLPKHLLLPVALEEKQLLWAQHRHPLKAPRLLPVLEEKQSPQRLWVLPKPLPKEDLQPLKVRQLPTTLVAAPL